MEKPDINLYLTKSNFSTMKYFSLLGLGFSIYFLFTDFFYSNIIDTDILYLYKFLDIGMAIISLLSVVFFIVVKIKNINTKKAGIIIFLQLFLLWAAVITGIDFKIYGLSTFIIVILLSTLFMYLELIVSISLFSLSFLTLLITINFESSFEGFSSLLILLIPTSVLSILMTYRNYKNKVNDMQNQEKILVMNRVLHNLNENLEEEVRIRTNEIQIALNKANESDKLKTAFLENMSHEIRTPLNGVVGFSKLITKPGLSNEKMQDYSRLIESCSKKIIQIVTDVISIAEVHTNQVENYNYNFDFIQLFNELVSNYEDRAKKKNIEYSVFKDENIKEFIINSDQKKLRTIINHLLDNAIKFTNEGHINIYLDMAEKELVIKVSDSGIGIPEEIRNFIFQPFRQAGKRTNRNYGGNGLGLSIVKAYVELLKGSVSFESELGKGSTFVVSIPIVKENSENQ